MTRGTKPTEETSNRSFKAPPPYTRTLFRMANADGVSQSQLILALIKAEAERRGVWDMASQLVMEPADVSA